MLRAPRHGLAVCFESCLHLRFGRDGGQPDVDRDHVATETQRIEPAYSDSLRRTGSCRVDHVHDRVFPTTKGGVARLVDLTEEPVNIRVDVRRYLSVVTDEQRTK